MTQVIRQPCDEGVIRSKEASSACTSNAAPWVLAVTILGSSMAFIDETAVPVALPAIQEALGATAVDAQWVVAAYTLFLAALVLVGGSLGDHLGRRRVFSIGVGLFALASVWCGLSPSPGQLTVARALQGVGAALLVPNSLAIIGASFAEARRGKAIGTWTSLTSVTLILGPVLGGYLAENVSWRGIYFINVPLAAVSWPSPARACRRVGILRPGGWTSPARLSPRWAWATASSGSWSLQGPDWAIRWSSAPW